MLCLADRSMSLFTHPERCLKIETLQLPDMSHGIHGKMGGSMKGGRENERENGGNSSSSHDAMTSEI